MKIVDLIQGTDPWLAWRDGRAFTDASGVDHPECQGVRVTATAASALGGHSPFGDANALYAERLGLRKKPQVSWVMQRGNTMEPQARAAYTALVGEEYEPACIQSSLLGFEWIAASMDGLDMLRTRGVEIKCPSSSSSHQIFLDGGVPPHYLDQIQWQHLAADNKLEFIDYFSFAPQFGAGNPIPVVPDVNRQQFLIDQAIKFRLAIETRIPMVGAEFDQAARAFLVLNRKAKALEAQLELAKERLKGIANGQSTSGSGVSVIVSPRAGGTAWEKVVSVLAEDYKIPDSEVERLKLLHKAKPSISISVKEAAEAEAILKEIDEAEQSSIQIEAASQEVLNPSAPIW